MLHSITRVGRCVSICFDSSPLLLCAFVHLQGTLRSKYGERWRWKRCCRGRRKISLVPCACCYDDLLKDNMFQCDSNQVIKIAERVLVTISLSTSTGKTRPTLSASCLKTASIHLAKGRLRRRCHKISRNELTEPFTVRVSQEVEGIW